MTSKLHKTLVSNLRAIKAIDLTCTAVNYFEKVLWACIGTIGVLWIFYVVTRQVQIWNENSTIITKGHFELTDVKYPAITICSKGTTAERLRNYLDSEKPLPNRYSLFRFALFLSVPYILKNK